MARHELRSRRPTTTCQKEPNEYREKIVDFIIFVEQQRRKFNYQHIYAADETAVYIDFSNSLTVEKRGAKEVRALHFSHCSRSGVNWFGKIGFKNFKVLKIGVSGLWIRVQSLLQVPVKTTGHEKLHITVLLTARSDGYKCKPFVLLPRVRPDKQIGSKFKGKLELCWAGRTFFNDQLTSDYLQKILGRSLFGKRLFVWDAYRCHISEGEV